MFAHAAIAVWPQHHAHGATVISADDVVPRTLSTSETPRVAAVVWAVSELSCLVAGRLCVGAAHEVVSCAGSSSFRQ